MKMINAQRPFMTAVMLLFLPCLACAASDVGAQAVVNSEPVLALDTFRAALVLITTIFIVPILLELAVGFVYISFKKLDSRILLYVLVANVVSFPVGFLAVIILSSFIPSPAFVLLLSGLLVVVLETLVIYYPSRNVFSLTHAFLFSLLLNVVGLSAEWLAVEYAATLMAGWVL